ncbi:MAG: NAD(P)H-binding protein [Alphaproteobacteria bacterium]
MILVTGATGRVGGEVLKRAVAAGVPVRALARDPARAEALKSIVEVVAGDFADPASLDTAVEGVEGVFMASFDGEKQAALQGNLIEACRRAGVRHVVRLGDDVDERRPAVHDRRAETRKRSAEIWCCLRAVCCGKVPRHIGKGSGPASRYVSIT